MSNAEIHALYDQDQRINIDFPKMRREATPDVVRLIDLSATGEGMVIYSQLDEANADEVIHEQVSYFESLGQDFEWKVYDYDRPEDLKERLQAFGFIIEDVEAVMVLDLEAAPEILRQPVRNDVRRILAADRIADVKTVEEQVWDEDFSWLAQFLGSALRNHPEQISVYVAYFEDQPVSAAWTYFPKKGQFASLWGGATVSGYRNQGLYTALLAVRAQEARARQVRYLSVDASAMSRPILEKFGFEKIAYTYPCKWKRASNH